MARPSQDPVVTLIRQISDWTLPDLKQFSVLRYLHRLQVDFSFLKAAMSFWDPQNHVFNFNGRELCPLPEEFSAILGIYLPSPAPLVLSFFRNQYPHEACAAFSFSPNEVTRVIPCPSSIELDALLVASAGMSAGSHAWGSAVLFCLLARYLLISYDSRRGDYRLLHLLPGIRNGHDPSAVIWAETLQVWMRLRVGLAAASWGVPYFAGMP